MRAKDHALVWIRASGHISRIADKTQTRDLRIALHAVASLAQAVSEEYNNLDKEQEEQDG